MKKIVKLSLVAAVAVAGLTTVNAKPLEEAIKNVEVSGMVGYRYDDWASDKGAANINNTTNKYKIRLNVSSKVNDDVKVHTRFIVGNGANGYQPLNTSGGDVQAGVNLSNVYFGYTGIKNTTVNVGKQGIPTPWTVAQSNGGSNANEQTGTGILALSTLGPVTVAAAYFNQTNFNTVQSGISGAADVATVGVIANVGPVALDAWAIQLSDVADSFTVGAKTSFNAISASVRYTSLELEGSKDTNSFLKVMLGAKVGIFNAGYTFGLTGKDGGFTAVDSNAATSFQGWALTTNAQTDATLHSLVVGVKAMDKLHLAVIHTMLDVGENTSNSETILKSTYKMSKNLSTVIMLSQNEVNKIDADRGRLEVVYTF